MDIPLDGPIRILLVDDDVNHSKVLGWRLAARGYQPETATSGPEAFRLLESRYFDLIILDVHLPQMDGRDIAQKLTEIPVCTHLPVIMLSSDASSATIGQFVNQQISGYLLKPVEFKKLVLLLQELEPAIRRRRDYSFVTQLANLNLEQSANTPELEQMLQSLQRSSFFREYISNPLLVPEKFRATIARTMSKFFHNLDQMLLDKMDVRNESISLGTLQLIEQITNGRHLGTRLTQLASSGQPAVASKAIKILGKSNPDMVHLRRFLLNPDPRFVANLLESIWDSDSPTAINLFRYYLNHGTPRIRANCIIGLHRHGHQPVALGALLDMLQSGDPHGRKSALWAVQHLKLLNTDTGTCSEGNSASDGGSRHLDLCVEKVKEMLNLPEVT